MRLLFLFIMIFAVENTIFARSAEETLRLLRIKMFDHLPTAFEARLTGKEIEEKLKSIPADYVVKGKQAFVLLSFHKRRGIEIQVQNVDELYTDLFRQYVRFFTLGPVLSTQDFSLLTNRYEIRYRNPETSSILELKIRHSENLFFLYLNTEKNILNRIDYLSGDRVLSSTVIISQNFSKWGRTYVIPVKFLVKTGGVTDRLPALFRLEKIRILKK